MRLPPAWEGVWPEAIIALSLTWERSYHGLATNFLSLNLFPRKYIAD
jgi:hypothetical protein